jgi:hypothetical protein
MRKLTNEQREQLRAEKAAKAAAAEASAKKETKPKKTKDVVGDVETATDNQEPVVEVSTETDDISS